MCFLWFIQYTLCSHKKKTGSQKSHLYKLSFSIHQPIRTQRRGLEALSLVEPSLSSYNILYNRMIQHIQLTVQSERDGGIRLYTVCRFALVPSLSRGAAATVRLKMNQQCSKQLAGVCRLNCNVRVPHSNCYSFFEI